MKTFECEVERGIAVMGYTPNLLLIAKTEYEKLETASKLLLALDTEKVTVCDGGVSESLVSLPRDANQNV